MAAHAFSTETKFDMGDVVCVDPTSGLAVLQGSGPGLVPVGAAFVPESGYNPNGRSWFAINGPPYYTNDFYEYKDDCTSDFSTENPSYTPFNPLTDTGYITVITHGIAPVKKGVVGLPESWILLQERTDFNWYLVK